MSTSDVGKIYRTGEVVVRQGDMGDAMYVIQDGKVEVVLTDAATTRRLAVLTAGDFFGEMGIFEHKPRSATVRALRRSRILTIDKRTLLQRVQQDPSLALRLLEKLSSRLRDLHAWLRDDLQGFPELSLGARGSLDPGEVKSATDGEISGER